MLVSYRWLQDYVDIPWEPEELAERLTMAGLEVEGITPLAPALDRVYVGLVTDARQHPRSFFSKKISIKIIKLKLKIALIRTSSNRNSN